MKLLLQSYKMKKLTTIFIAFLLFLGTIGPSLQLHYCGGKLFSYSFFHKAKTCCGGACTACKDVAVFYKIKDKFEKNNITVTAPLLKDITLLVSSTDQVELRYLGFNRSFTSTQPPPLCRKPFLFFEVFRI